MLRPAGRSLQPHVSGRFPAIGAFTFPSRGCSMRRSNPGENAIVAKKKIAVVGIGKISQDQHLPVIDKSRDFELAACVSTRGLGHRGVPVFRTPAEFYRAMPDVGLVSICTPPGVRHAYVREAIDAGKDVLLEKP